MKPSPNARRASHTPSQQRPRLSSLLLRSLRLRCPRCGTGRLFAGWFTMFPECPACHLPFHRESGFYLGTIYVNYGVTALASGIGYPLLLLGGVLTRQQTLLVTLAFAVLFPIWFFRYARSLWLAADSYLDPQRPDLPGQG